MPVTLTCCIGQLCNICIYGDLVRSPSTFIDFLLGLYEHVQLNSNTCVVAIALFEMFRRLAKTGRLLQSSERSLLIMIIGVRLNLFRAMRRLQTDKRRRHCVASDLINGSRRGLATMDFQS